MQHRHVGNTSVIKCQHKLQQDSNAALFSTIHINRLKSQTKQILYPICFVKEFHFENGHNTIQRKAIQLFLRAVPTTKCSGGCKYKSKYIKPRCRRLQKIYVIRV
jgi:hypothetical protein